MELKKTARPNRRTELRLRVSLAALASLGALLVLRIGGRGESCLPVRGAARATATGRASGGRSGVSPRARTTPTFRLAFEPNIGQTSSQAKFVAHGESYVAFLTGNGMVLSLGGPQSGVRGQTRQWPVVSGNWQARTDYGQRTMDLFHSPFTIQNSSFSRTLAPSTQHLAPSLVRLNLVGANPHPKIVGLDKLKGKS